MPKTFIFAFFACFIASSALLAKPQNYDECILENIPNAQTDAAVAAVRRACRSLFPLPKKKEVVPKEANFKWKKVYLDKVNGSYTRSSYEAVVINDTGYAVESVTLVYKTLPCEKPTSAAVAQVQKKLNEKGINAGRVDGKMGGQTREALRTYQKSISQKVDGKISDEILVSLNIDTNIGWLSATRSLFPLLSGSSSRVKWQINENSSNICSYVQSWVKEYE